MRDDDYSDYLRQKEKDRKKTSYVPYEKSTDHYWEEIKSRQVGENKPDYDPWTGGWY